MSPSGDIFTAWITKYALTRGIFTDQAQECMDGENKTGMIRVIAPLWHGESLYHGEGRDWHRTEASAVRRAIEVTTKKLNNLEQQSCQMGRKLDSLIERQKELAKEEQGAVKV